MPLHREFYYQKTKYGAVLAVRTNTIPGPELLLQRLDVTLQPDKLFADHRPKRSFLSKTNHNAILVAEARREVVERTGCAACKYGPPKTKRVIRTPGHYPLVVFLDCNAVQVRKPDCLCQPGLKPLQYPSQRIFKLLKPLLYGYSESVLSEGE